MTHTHHLSKTGGHQHDIPLAAVLGEAFAIGLVSYRKRRKSDAAIEDEGRGGEVLYRSFRHVVVV